MLKVITHLRPIYNDLIDLDINEYLITTRFERLCNYWGSIEEWENSIEKATKLELLGNYSFIEARFAILMNNIYSEFEFERSQNVNGRSKVFLAYIISDFMEWRKKELDFKDFSKSLEFFFEKSSIDFISKSYKKSIKEKKEDSKVFLQQTLQETYPIEESYIDKKKRWKTAISKAKIEEIVDEIIEFGVENENNFIGLSRRWHTLKNDYHKGVIERKEYEIENNKITDALLNFIENLKDTEGV